jgi:hypothetical protein
VRIVGLIATAVIIVIALWALIVLIRSIPDIRRYLKIRSM